MQRLSLSDINEEEEGNTSEEESEEQELQDADEEVLGFVTDCLIDRRGAGELNLS